MPNRTGHDCTDTGHQQRKRSRDAGDDLPAGVSIGQRALFRNAQHASPVAFDRTGQSVPPRRGRCPSGAAIGHHYCPGIWRFALRLWQCLGVWPLRCAVPDCRAVDEQPACTASGTEQRQGHAGLAIGRHSLHPPSPGRAGRDLTGFICRATGRRNGALAGICQRHPAHRPVGPGHVALGTGSGCAADVIVAGPVPGRTQGRPHHVYGRGRVRCRHHCVRAVDILLVFNGSPGRARRGGHDQHGDSRVVRATANPG